jgi:GDP-4-dehydro-6-deoxy-D-mannose reductase
MKTILVTGASGALGRAVTAALRRRGGSRVIEAHRGSVDPAWRLDLRDPPALAAVFERARPDLVLHLAATFSNELAEAHVVNVEAARCLMEAMLRRSGVARLLLVGSAAEYGVVQPEENPVKVGRPLRPVSVYGLTKAWQSQLAGLYAQLGVDIVVARIFNLDGPGVSEGLFVGRLRRQIEEFVAGRRSEIEVGPLSAVRDYVSTEQAAEQVLAIAMEGTAGGTYHVASGVPVRMRDVLARHLAVHGIDLRVVREAPESSNRSGYDVPAIYAEVDDTLRLTQAWRAAAHA